MIDNKCAFNYIYKFDGNHLIENVPVRDIRRGLSESLAKQLVSTGLRFDIVSGIPNTGFFYAEDVAKSMGVDFLRIFEKRNEQRTLGKVKVDRLIEYNALLATAATVPSGASVLFIDEALLSGLTVRVIANACKEIGLTDYSFAFMSPITYCQCPWAHIKNADRYFTALNDFSSTITKAQLIEKLRVEVGAKGIYFCEEEAFYENINEATTCTLCFYDDFAGS